VNVQHQGEDEGNETGVSKMSGGGGGKNTSHKEGLPAGVSCGVRRDRWRDKKGKHRSFGHRMRGLKMMWLLIRPPGDVGNNFQSVRMHDFGIVVNGLGTPAETRILGALGERE